MNVTATDALGCTALSNTLIYTSVSAGSLIVNAGPDTTTSSSSYALGGASVTGGVGPYTYLWEITVDPSSGDASISNPTTLSSAVLIGLDFAAGAYTVKLTAVDTANPARTGSDTRVITKTGSGGGGATVTLSTSPNIWVSPGGTNTTASSAAYTLTVVGGTPPYSFSFNLSTQSPGVDPVMNPTVGTITTSGGTKNGTITIGTYACAPWHTVTAKVIDNLGTTYYSSQYYTTDKCHLAGTLIKMADGSVKKVEDITKEDEIASTSIITRELWQLYYDARNPIIDQPKFSTKVEEISEITVNTYININNGALRITSEHPILVYAKDCEDCPGLYKFNTAYYLKVGDIIVNEKGEHIEITSIENIDDVVKVYSLACSPKHTYIADGIVVHNKPPCP
jgi:hypothetical protein